MDLSRARAAQQAWAAVSVDARCRLLSSLRKSVLAHADDLADVLCDELGKVRNEALMLDVAVAAMTLSAAATMAPAALSTKTLPSFIPALPRAATSTWKPRGLCALLSPWNYPLAIPMATIAAALAGGNGVVWKPSERCPRSSRKLLEVLQKGGLPADLILHVEGGADEGAAVVDADVDHVTFVGSSAVGRRVAAACGARLVPCVIEGGGNAPAIVLDDADVDRAAAAIVFGGFANGGQSCVAVERVYATPGVFDALLAKTRALASSLRPGVDLCRPVLVERDAALRTEAARFDGEKHNGVVDVTGAATSLVDDESFGAVVAFVKVDDEDAAVREANRVAQQLAAYVFAARPRARRVAARLRAPMVGIDDVMMHYALPGVPFGGVSASGFGRTHGVEGLRALCVEQVIVEPTLPVLLSKEPWWSPYNIDAGPWIGFLDKTLALLERLRRR